MATRDFRQLSWDEAIEDDCRQLVRLAVREDLDRELDWTTLALIDETRTGAAAVVARQPGVVCGVAATAAVIAELESSLQWRPERADGDSLSAGETIGVVRGPVREMLTAERLILNIIGRLSGVATLTSNYVEAAAGQAAIYDTRKTTPGWRRLEKFAVRCGGGRNHRTGLFDAVLIKDNHLAAGPDDSGTPWRPDEAVRRARRFVQAQLGDDRAAEMLVEVEVDTLEQFDLALEAAPDIVLLDNFSLEHLRDAVAKRDQRGATCELEASGGVTLDSIAAIAATGVERISVGALTHSAIGWDVAMDWKF